MSLMLTRRQMIEQLGGGLGVVGLAGLFASLSRNTVHAAGLGNYPVPLVAPKAKHVIMLYMNGGPSQLDMFDPEAGAVQVRRTAAERGGSPYRANDRRPAAVAVRVQALRAQRCRGERAAATARECHRRRVRHSIDVHVQPHTYARPRLVPHRQRAGDASVDGIVDYVTGLGLKTRTSPRSSRSATPTAGGPQNRSAFLPTEYQGVGFAVADPDPEKIIPNLRNKNVDKDAQRTDMDALLHLNQTHAKSFGADQFLEGRIKSMETAYRMQFEALELFDIRKEPSTFARNTAPARSATAACWRGALSKRACATSTWIIRAGRSGTTIAT